LRTDGNIAAVAIWASTGRNKTYNRKAIQSVLEAAVTACLQLLTVKTLGQLGILHQLLTFSPFLTNQKVRENIKLLMVLLYIVSYGTLTRLEGAM